LVVTTNFREQSHEEKRYQKPPHCWLRVVVTFFFTRNFQARTLPAERQPMFEGVQSRQFEAWIRARSHAIWERGGRHEGRAAENWFQARREIEAMRQAAIDGETTVVVPPQVAVSKRPIRRVSPVCNFGSERLAA